MARVVLGCALLCLAAAAASSSSASLGSGSSSSGVHSIRNAYIPVKRSSIVLKDPVDDADAAIERLIKRGDVLMNGSYIYPGRILPGNNDETISLDDSQLPQLRLDWNSRRVRSPLAQRIEAAQQRCLYVDPKAPPHKKGYILLAMNNFGLGSDLHTWSQAMCIALEHNVSLVIRGYGEWTWASKEFLDRPDLGHHPMDSLSVYFGDETEGKHCPHTPGRDAFKGAQKSEVMYPDPYMSVLGRHVIYYSTCPSIIKDKESRHVLRAAAMEYLFTRVRPEVILAARRLRARLFPSNPRPEQMIAIHIRWGDKVTESPLAPMIEYLRLVEKLIDERNIQSPHVLLMTEDERAANEFKDYVTRLDNGEDIFTNSSRSSSTSGIAGDNRTSATTSSNGRGGPKHRNADGGGVFGGGNSNGNHNKGKGGGGHVSDDSSNSARRKPHRKWEWAINMDAVFKTNLPPAQVATSSKGAAGLESLTTLLVALEADNYVLSTDSNWSRLVDELRRSIVDAKCYNNGDPSTCITKVHSLSLANLDWR